LQVGEGHVGVGDVVVAAKHEKAAKSVVPWVTVKGLCAMGNRNDTLNNIKKQLKDAAGVIAVPYDRLKVLS
jgi:hypothetical protein